jgi:uncharacterized protein (TIGR02145 family)
MKRIFFLIAIFPALTANAQNYFITFAGTGAANTVDSVKVENLRTGISLTLKGDDILHLTGTVGIPSSEYDKPGKLKIYPNPMKDNSIIEIFPSIEGEAIISVFDMTGRQLSQIQNYLDKSRQELRLSGLKDGFYLINVRGNNYQYSGKLLCTGQSDGTLSIEKVSNNIEVFDEKTSEMENKGSQDSWVIPMLPGDRLKYTGYSGDYGTVTTGIPTQDATVTFDFVPCSDGDNKYLALKIGTQIWMAENLKTTKYNNGDLIGTTTPATLDIHSETNQKYQWAYDGNESIAAIYGRLYTWYAITDSRKVCPTGWHIPNDAEWETLIDYLNGENTAGSKLKETGTSHWQSHNEDASDEYGFTALPGGSRNLAGNFESKGAYGFWWSSSAHGTENLLAGYQVLYFNQTWILSTDNYDFYGLSVRCVKDN